MTFGRVLIACAAIFISACGGGSGGASGLANPGTALTNDSSVPAQQVLTDVTVGLSAEDLASFDGAEARTYKRRLVGVLSSSVTSERFDAVLKSVGARMVGYDSSTGVVQLQVPEQGSLDALEALASKLAQSGAFESIATQGRSAAERLPDGMSPSSAITRLGHQLAIRADMIWSVQAAMTSATQVQTIVVDEFGGGAPAFGLPSVADGFSSSILTAHGYAVAGILAADFGGGTGDFGQVTGVSLAPSRLHVIDMSPGEASGYYKCSWGGCDDIQFMIDRLSEKFKNQPAGSRFVVNVSRGWSGNPVEDYRPKVEVEAKRWQKLLMLGGKPGYEHFDYQRDVVQVSSAGNAARDAAWNSGWNRSALVLKPGSGLVVEARAVNRLASARPTAACRTAYSNVNGNVAAVGGVNALQVSSGDVWTYTSPTTAGFAGAGTSFAAPQVAGMAVSLLALKPEMTATEVVDVIKSTSVSDGCQGAPIVDAYAAILMLDQEARAPVRTALIRGLSAVQSKPIASEAVEFLQAYYPDAYGIQSVAATLDFGRFDLNGDGITGGSSTARFPRIGTAGMENLTDFQALCGLTKSAIFDQTGMDTFKQHILKVAASSQANSTQVLSTCYDSSLRVSGSATMVVGQRQQLGWEILFGGVAVASPFAQRSDPSMAANLTWQVAGASLSIDGTGAAQALSPGIATVTVSDRSGLRTVFTINIQADATCVVNPVNNTGWASVQRLVCTNYSRSGRLVNITEQTQVAFDGSRHLLVVEEDLTAGNFNFIYFEWDKSGAFIVNGKGGGKTGFGPANSAEYCAKHVCLPNVSIRGAYSPGATNVGNNGGSWGQYRHIVRYTYDARGVFTGEDTLLCGLQIPPTSDTAVYVSRKRSPDPVVHTSQSDFTGCPTIAEIDSINALTLGDSLLHQSGYNYR